MKSKQTLLHPLIVAATGGIIFAALIISLRVSASGVVQVTGNTSAGENQPGWLFNRDMTTSAPYSFTHDRFVNGVGSLYVGPIANLNFGSVSGNNPHHDMFIADYYTGGAKVSDFDSFAFDYSIGAGSVDNKSLVSISLYTSVDATTTGYDCRFDYVAKDGSLSAFRKVYAKAAEAPDGIAPSETARIACPAMIGGMPDGSLLTRVAISVGDTTAADGGLSVYIDNAELVLTNDYTSFDFEPRPRTKEDCSGDKWKLYKFRNQGQCIKSI